MILHAKDAKMLTMTSMQYIFDVSTKGREHEQLKNIREATFKKYSTRLVMAVPPDEGLFLSILIKLMNAKKTLEIGVFTGYSLLTTALALPRDGQIVAIDPDREAYEVGLPFIREAGVEHKINFIHSEAFPALAKLQKNGEQFDFIFVDADKDNYKKYHDQVIKMVKVGGVIAYDNTLWLGTVAGEENGHGSLSQGALVTRDNIVDFNSNLALDSRIEISQISIGDGVTLCRRIL
uniref:Uncharacterized protein n=1 Tax=Daucus carota subsp. sativus TaxID=79200 RepID=A0A175YHR8_DAUCS